MAVAIQIEGNVLYGFDIETAKAIAGTMMGEELDELDEIALSALGELANMISGNAATERAAAGFC
ncbi:MAG: chemotaxis protein CheX [Chloroflexi bacterium]|nr:chemotaxis protein CheX [Chloroflexota bacterium]